MSLATGSGEMGVRAALLALSAAALASCAVPTSRPTSFARRMPANEGHVQELREGLPVESAVNPVADEPASSTSPAPTFDAPLPPLPAPSRMNRSERTPPRFRPPPPCGDGTAWDGLACASSTCALGSRFEPGTGCVSCAFLGCDANPERHIVDDPAWDDFMLPAFDSAAARAALSKIDLSACRPKDGPTVTTYATITFGRSGKVHHVELGDGPLSHSLAGRCIVDRLRAVRVARSRDGANPVGRSFTIDASAGHRSMTRAWSR